jgi:large subunit ribosomal protein L17
MLRNIAAGLFEHGQIVTTIPKAKAVQPFVEKIISDAKEGTLASRRRVIAKLGADRLGFEWLYLPKNASDEEKNHVEKLREFTKSFFEIPASSEVERNRYGELRKAPRLVKHIFDHIAPKYTERAGGYTRIVKLGRNRIGDGTELCVLQFVGNEDGAEVKGRPSRRRKAADNRTAFLAKLRKEKESAKA